MTLSAACDCMFRLTFNARLSFVSMASPRWAAKTSGHDFVEQHVIALYDFINQYTIRQ